MDDEIVKIEKRVITISYIFILIILITAMLFSDTRLFVYVWWVGSLIIMSSIRCARRGKIERELYAEIEKERQGKEQYLKYIKYLINKFPSH